MVNCIWEGRPNTQYNDFTAFPHAFELFFLLNAVTDYSIACYCSLRPFNKAIKTLDHKELVNNWLSSSWAEGERQ